MARKGWLRRVGKKMGLIRPKSLPRHLNESKVAFPHAPKFEKQFRPLAHFIGMEATFFPSLEAFRRHVTDQDWEKPGAVHANGGPNLIGNSQKDKRLFDLCGALAERRVEVSDALRNAMAVVNPKHVVSRGAWITKAQLLEEEVNQLKREARGLLLEAVRRLHAQYAKEEKPAQLVKYPRYKPYLALRLFVTEEMRWSKFLRHLRSRLVSSELGSQQPSFFKHYPNGVVDLTNNRKTDFQIAAACSRIFGLRNQIRKKVVEASLTTDHAKANRLLNDAQALESSLDLSKALVRRALIELARAPDGIKNGSKDS